MMNALLLIAHGSRRAEANADLEHVAAAMRQRQSFDIVQVSYLELADPTIPVAADLCVERGATEVTMMPYFLSPGVHVRDDLEEFLGQFRESYPNVRFRLAEPLGRHPLLLDIVEQRVNEATAQPIVVE